MEKIHRFLATAIAVTLALAWVLFVGQATRAASTTSPADHAFAAGTACLLQDLKQGRFTDPYLNFVYPDERLPTTSTGPISYRQVDAYVVLTQIGRAGPVPPALALEIDHAERKLDESAKLWLGRGFNNTLANPRPEGVGLDTYCMVGWLFGSADMADEAAGALTRDRWLPERWYDGEEAFRGIADESWCVRLLSLDPAANRERIRPLLERLRQEQQADSHPRPNVGDFYTAWHLGMLVAEHASDDSLADAIGNDAIEVLERWSASRLASGPPAAEDMLEWANLASAEILHRFGEGGATLQGRAMDALLSAQQGDGCWSFDDSPTRDGRSFLTLRALLALQRYRFGSRFDSRKPAP